MNLTRVAIFSLCAALLGAPACKDTSGAGTDTPATRPDDAATPGGTPPGDAKPADPADKPATDDPKVPAAPTTAAYVECTPDTRKGGMCTREYRPVCGKKADESRQTFANKCTACSDLAIVGYFEGSCEAGPTPEK